MTRKRFVKLLMSGGMQRNEAERKEMIVRALWTYEEFYWQYSLPHRAITYWDIMKAQIPKEIRGLADRIRSCLVPFNF